jgi:hypothetical protein
VHRQEDRVAQGWVECAASIKSGVLGILRFVDETRGTRVVNQMGSSSHKTLGRAFCGPRPRFRRPGVPLHRWKSPPREWKSLVDGNCGHGRGRGCRCTGRAVWPIRRPQDLAYTWKRPMGAASPSSCTLVDVCGCHGDLVCAGWSVVVAPCIALVDEMINPPSIHQTK